MRKTLKPGEYLYLLCTARIGASGTVADLSIDWDRTANFSRALGVSENVGSVDYEGKVYEVLLDRSTRELYFYDEKEVDCAKD